MASLILFKGAALPEFADELAMVVAWVIGVVFGPLLFFAPQLVAAKKTGLFEYGRLAARHMREFDTKWIAGRAPPGEPLVGSPDISSQADLSGAYSVVEGMRLAPISYIAVMRLAAMTLIPAAPLLLTEFQVTLLNYIGLSGIVAVGLVLLTMVPFNELVLKLFSIAL